MFLRGGVYLTYLANMLWLQMINGLSLELQVKIREREFLNAYVNLQESLLHSFAVASGVSYFECMVARCVQKVDCWWA